MYHVLKYDDSDCFVIRFTYKDNDRPEESLLHQLSREPYESWILDRLIPLAPRFLRSRLAVPFHSLLSNLAQEAQLPMRAVDWLGLALFATHHLQTNREEQKTAALQRLAQDLCWCHKHLSPQSQPEAIV